MWTMWQGYEIEKGEVIVKGLLAKQFWVSGKLVSPDQFIYSCQIMSYHHIVAVIGQLKAAGWEA